MPLLGVDSACGGPGPDAQRHDAAGQPLREVQGQDAGGQLALEFALQEGQATGRRVHQGGGHQGRDRLLPVPQDAESPASGDEQERRRLRRRCLGGDVEGRVRGEGAADAPLAVLHQPRVRRPELRYRGHRRRLHPERRNRRRQEGLPTRQVGRALRSALRRRDLDSRLPQGRVQEAGPRRAEDLRRRPQGGEDHQGEDGNGRPHHARQDRTPGHGRLAVPCRAHGRPRLQRQVGARLQQSRRREDRGVPARDGEVRPPRHSVLQLRRSVQSVPARRRRHVHRLAEDRRPGA